MTIPDLLIPLLGRYCQILGTVVTVAVCVVTEGEEGRSMYIGTVYVYGLGNFLSILL